MAARITANELGRKKLVTRMLVDVTQASTARSCSRYLGGEIDLAMPKVDIEGRDGGERVGYLFGCSQSWPLIGSDMVAKLSSKLWSVGCVGATKLRFATCKLGSMTSCPSVPRA